MFFKKMIFCIAMSLSLTACSWWGGDVSDNKIIKLNEAEVLGNSTCIDELSSFFSNYFSGTTSGAEINRNFECVEDTVDTIFENAKEKNDVKGFARKEINQILTTIFPKKEKVFLEDSIEFLFLIKRLFVGGAVDGFTRSEHLKLKSVVPKVRLEFLNSRTAVKHMFQGSNMSFEERNSGLLQLSESFKALDRIKKENGGQLKAEEGNALIESIFKNDTLKKFKSLAYVAKTFVFNDSPETFLKSQGDFFERLMRVFEVQARIRALNFQKGFLFGKSYYDLEKGLLLTSESLLKWASFDNNWFVHVDSFADILSASRDAGFWVDKFSDPDLVSLSIKKMLTQIFEKEKLDFNSTDRLNFIFKGWVSRQESIISKYSFSWILKKRDFEIDAESNNIVVEVESFKFPQFVSESGAPIIIKRDGNSLVPAELYFDQSLKHLLISMANEVFKAYSAVQPFTKGSARKRITLSLSEITRIFQDVRPLGLEFGFNDPHHCGSEERVLREADSFTLSGNGDGRISIKEAVEWLATMISVGSVSDRVFKRIEESCALPGLNLLGSPFLDRSCALKQLAGNERMLVDHFPGTFTYVDMLKSDARRRKFEKQLGGLIGWFDGLSYSKESHTEFLLNRFNSYNSCSEKESFPFSKREFSSSLAINIYVENLYHQFDKTGVDSWWPGTNDPKGSDFIIDGAEFSDFVEAKAVSWLDILVPLYKSRHYSTRYLSNSRVKRILKNLPENANYIDRSRGFQLIKMFLSVGEKEKRHPFLNQFCEDVSRTQKGEIFYRKEDRLMCLPSDMEFF